MKKVKNRPLLSIAVLSNNSSNLERCINSLLNQTYQNIEIVILNLANEKNIIIDNFLNEDKRIKYFDISKKDNYLLNIDSYIKGDYIALIDENEYVTIDYYRTLINSAIKNNSEIVFGNIVYENDDKKYELALNRLNFDILNKEEIITSFFKQCGCNLAWYTLRNKIYSINIWKKAINSIDSNTISFDITLSMLLFYYANKISRCYNDAIIYKEIDISKVDNLSLIKDKINESINSFEYMLSVMKKIKIYNKYKDDFNSLKKILKSYYSEIIDNKELLDDEKKEFNDLLNKLSQMKAKSNDLLFFQSIKTPWDDRLESFKKEIVKSDIEYISFDIFDTLVTRPFYYPKDLFKMLDDDFTKLANRNSIKFSNMRVISEQTTREIQYKNNPVIEEITLDEIYETIHDTYGIDEKILSKMKELEIENEIKYCKKRNTSFELYELALETGKKVICTSDMYLPITVVKEILNSCEYDIDNIYLSSSIKKTKSTGNLYKYVIDKLKIKPQKIIHIGDNYQTDFENARNNDILSMFFPKAIDAMSYSNNLLKIFDTSLPFWQDNRASLNFLGIRTMIAVVANKYFDNPYRSFNKETDFNADPFLIGYYVLGMFNYGITKWLLDSTNNINDKIVFMARDGYLPMMTYEILKNIYDKPAKTEYFYTSRKALMPVIVSDELDFYKLTDILNYNYYSPKKLYKYIKNIININEDIIKEACKKNNINYEKKFESMSEFNNYIIVIKEFYNKENHIINQEKLRKYLNKVFDGKSAVFDVGYSGRPEYYIGKLCNKKIDTFFLNINTDESFDYSHYGDYKLNTFFDYKPAITGNAYELLISKCAPSCIGYDLSKEEAKPIFEEYRASYCANYIIETIQSAAIELTSDLYHIFDKDLHKLYFQKFYVSMPLMMYLNSSKKVDKEILGLVYFEDDLGTIKNTRMIDNMNEELMSKNQLNVRYLFNIKKIIKIIKEKVAIEEENQKKIEELEAKNNTSGTQINLSEKNKFQRIAFYTLFDRKTLKRRVKEVLHIKRK